MTLVSTVGGASGPLYGTLFLRDGRTLGDAAEVAPDRVRRRRCAPGSTGSSHAARPRPATRRCTTRWPRPSTRSRRGLGDGRDLGRRARRWPAVAAEAGRDATIPMLARKGRASYLGERSVGHQDPGATSVALLVAAAARHASPDRQTRAEDAAMTFRAARRRHRRRLAQPGPRPGRAWRWPREMLHGRPVRIEVAAGLDETTFGTDAVAGQAGDRGGRRPRRRRRPDGSRQCRPQRRARPRPARRPHGPRPGHCCPRPRSSRGSSSPRSRPPAARAGPRSPPRRAAP